MLIPSGLHGWMKYENPHLEEVRMVSWDLMILSGGKSLVDSVPPRPKIVDSKENWTGKLPVRKTQSLHRFEAWVEMVMKSGFPAIVQEKGEK